MGVLLWRGKSVLKVSLYACSNFVIAWEFDANSVLISTLKFINDISICDFWFSSFLFTVNINSNVAAIQSNDFGNFLDNIFKINEGYLNFLTSKAMVTLFLLAIAYVLVANAIIKRQEQTRIKHTAEDLAFGRLNTNVPVSAEPEAQTVSETPEEKLAKLKKMYESELITKEEYEEKKSSILKDM